MGLLVIISNYLRGITLVKYNVEENNCCDCGENECMNSFCNNLYYGCHYPCSLFQILVSIQYWDQEDLFLPINDRPSVDDKVDINWKLYE